MSATSTQQAAHAPSEVWASGDYADVCDRMIPALGARLVQIAGVSPGERVLDVAAGSGNATLPAASVGAEVTALDITPSLLEIGAARANEAGLRVTWVHGDAQALPFPDAGYDRVLSCVGVQFCADQQAAARELLRVCRPGGVIALIAWTPEGFIGQVLAAVGGATGGTSPGRPTPLQWGRERGVEELFPDSGEVVFHREHAEMGADSPGEWVDYMARAYGPMVRARSALEQRGGWLALRERLVEIAAAHDGGDAGRFKAGAEYLIALIER